MNEERKLTAAPDSLRPAYKTQLDYAEAEIHRLDMKADAALSEGKEHRADKLRDRAHRLELVREAAIEGMTREMETRKIIEEAEGKVGFDLTGFPTGQTHAFGVTTLMAVPTEALLADGKVWVQADDVAGRIMQADAEAGRMVQAMRDAEKKTSDLTERNEQIRAVGQYAAARIGEAWAVLADLLPRVDRDDEDEDEYPDEDEMEHTERERAVSVPMTNPDAPRIPWKDRSDT